MPMVRVLKTSMVSMLIIHREPSLFVSANPATALLIVWFMLIAGVGLSYHVRWRIYSGTIDTFLNYVTQYTKPFNDISSVLSELLKCFWLVPTAFILLDVKMKYQKQA